MTFRIAAFSAPASKAAQGGESGPDAGAGAATGDVAEADVADDTAEATNADPEATDAAAADFAVDAAADATPAPNTDRATTNRMLRRVAMGIMVQFLRGLMRDDGGDTVSWEIGGQYTFAIRRVCRGARFRGNWRA
jgi:hypothetical protein